MIRLALIALAVVAGLMAYIRLAPTDPAQWHVSPAMVAPENSGWRTWVLYPPRETDGVVAMAGGAYVASFVRNGIGPDVLARLDAVAMATPRTTRIAGSPEEGRITWQVRSAFWGFPDYVTAEAEPRGSNAMTFPEASGTILFIVSRQRFGNGDQGVNAARLRDWLARL